MDDYLNLMAVQSGTPLWVIVMILFWSYIWKILALWKSARKGSLIWFIILALPLNTVGILEILYIFAFSKITFFNFKTNKKTSSKKKVSKKKSTKKRIR